MGKEHTLDPKKPHPSQDHKGSAGDPKSSILSLFAFTSNTQIFSLLCAIALSIASGLIIPTFAILLGKLFDAFTEFGANRSTGTELVHMVSMYGVGLVVLGGASGLLNSVFFASWLFSGELLAKVARERIFESLLEKDIRWFDEQECGTEALISRTNT